MWGAEADCRGLRMDCCVEVARHCDCLGLPPPSSPRFAAGGATKGARGGGRPWGGSLRRPGCLSSSLHSSFDYCSQANKDKYLNAFYLIFAITSISDRGERDKGKVGRSVPVPVPLPVPQCSNKFELIKSSFEMLHRCAWNKMLLHHPSS
jgi:hypothetical protein